LPLARKGERAQNRKARIEVGFYSTHILPRLVEWSLGSAIVRDQRRATLAPLRGHVLEIGFGTGLNLLCYPPQVTRLTAIDSQAMLPRRVADRIARAQVQVEQLRLDAGGLLPFEDQRFDGVVTTFTLCSIANVAAALSEIRRVLKPEAEYVFLEHGRSDDPRIAKNQDRANPITRLIGCGCNMNRPIDKLVSAAGLKITRLDRFVMPDSPRILGEIYRGVAKSEM
jgi:ubiquinone/menaquinone biosynthesis C-methylase UbiE